MSMGSLITAAREGLSHVAAALSFFFTIPVMLPLALLGRRHAQPWVISGHRGRIYADNAAAVHRELVRRGQPVTWITGDDALLRKLRHQGLSAAQRHSIAARWAILRAPVLIYSHGESDLDLFLILLRRVLGLRVYLNHCMNHVKAGNYYSPVYDQLRGFRKWFYEYVSTDFDLLLASSESERRNFELAFPHKKDVMRLGGGAHMDRFIQLVATSSRTKDIVYFPTFRDDASGKKQLNDVIEALLRDTTLQAWLEREGLRLLIGAHINTGGYALKPGGKIEWLKPSEIVDAMCTTQAFISDYSGLLADSLLLDIPVIFFPFDLDDYLSTRRLFHDYERFAFGPKVTSVDELVALLVSGQWQDLEPWAAHRRAFRDEIIPSLEPKYAAQSVDAILDVLREREGVQ